jgi:diguanylate cyclase (GGDEF)-like protein
MSRRARIAWTTVAFLLIPAIGLADYMAGPEITFTLVYIAPVTLVAWLASRRLALAASMLSALAWIAADYALGRVDPNVWIYAWNFSSRLIPLLVVSELLSALKTTLRQDRELSLTDSLTGAMNRRAFREAAERELSRARRHGRPITLAYFDIDDFKNINDSRGHDGGDRLLKGIVATLSRNLRESDGVARIGGDEFALLLPEVGPDDAPTTVEKVIRRLRDVTRHEGMPVTFSVGVVMCRDNPPTLELLLLAADRLMYGIKADKKDGVAFAELPVAPPVPVSVMRSISAA